jgi:hypothetical protein
MTKHKWLALFVWGENDATGTTHSPAFDSEVEVSSHSIINARDLACEEFIKMHPHVTFELVRLARWDYR